MSAHAAPPLEVIATVAPTPPLYPTFLPLPAGSCPVGTVRVVAATGWTCASPEDAAAIVAYRWTGRV